MPNMDFYTDQAQIYSVDEQLMIWKKLCRVQCGAGLRVHRASQQATVILILLKTWEVFFFVKYNDFGCSVFYDRVIMVVFPSVLKKNFMRSMRDVNRTN